MIIAIAGMAFSHGWSAQAPASGPDAEACKNCHVEQYNTYAGSKHGVKGDNRTPANAGGCATCHGNGSEHVKAGGGKGVGGIINPGSKTLASAARNSSCMSCHQKGRGSWPGSKHQTNDVACASCHTMHQPRDKVLNKATQTEVCFACHKTQRAEINRASTHPVRAGLMACSSCHNTHGSTGPAQLVKNTLNETCYTCHAEKRGPYLWEHPPASDNCANCHTPHGSNHSPLLKARAPMLCQSCHLTSSGHPNVLRSGTGIAATGAQAQIALRACLNCHTQVHGSNHPSGPRFVR